MQLNSILHLTGELVQGSGDSPSDDSADTDALLPFAAVLSGAFSLVAPIQEAGAEQAQILEVAAEGDDAPGPARQPLQLLDLDGIDPSEISGRPLDLTASPTCRRGRAGSRRLC